MNTKIFDLVTLTLKFFLLLKNFNLGNSFLTRRGRAFIFHICIPCSKIFNAVPSTMIFDLVTLTLKLTYFIKQLIGTMTFESEGLYIVAIYIWLPPASYVVFLTTLVLRIMLFSPGLNVYKKFM